MRSKKIIKNAYKIIIPLISVGVFVLIWAIVAKSMGKEIILPSPLRVLESLGTLLNSPDFYKAAGLTLLRSLESYAIAFGLALFFAVVSALSSVVEKALSPIVTIARAVPTMSVILLALIWLSSGNAPIFVAFLVIFPLLYTGMLESIKRVDKGLVAMSKVYSVRRFDIVTKLYLRETLPSVFTLMRSTLSFNLKLIIAGEVLAYTSMSMGLLMWRSSAYLDTSTLLAWTVAAIVLGYLLELFVLLLQKLLIRWNV